MDKHYLRRVNAPLISDPDSIRDKEHGFVESGIALCEALHYMIRKQMR